MHYGKISVAGNVPFTILSNKVGLSSGLDPKSTGDSYISLPAAAVHMYGERFSHSNSTVGIHYNSNF